MSIEGFLGKTQQGVNSQEYIDHEVVERTVSEMLYLYDILLFVVDSLNDCHLAIIHLDKARNWHMCIKLITKAMTKLGNN